ncbi:hypothetical protein Tco_1185726 [Tanacetum coccineum]
MEQMTTLRDLVDQAIQKKEEEKRIAEEQAAKDRSWKIPICYDDDEDNTIAITPVSPIEEPDNSLSMGDEHLDTIPETESDEFIKSSVENLVPIPSESEGIPDKMCDVPLCNNPTPPNALKEHSETIIDSDDDNSSSDDDSPYGEDIEYFDASPPDVEIVSLEVVEIVDPEVGRIDDDILLTIKDDILREKLLNVNLLIAKIDSLRDNPTPSSEVVIKSTSTFPNLFLEETNTFDNSFPESETFRFNLEEISSGIAPPYLLSCGDEDIIFDPGISNYHSFMPDVSHRSGTFIKFNVYPNRLNGSPYEILSSHLLPQGSNKFGETGQASGPKQALRGGTPCLSLALFLICRSGIPGLMKALICHFNLELHILSFILGIPKTDNQEKDEKQSQNDKTRLGMEKTVKDKAKIKAGKSIKSKSQQKSQLVKVKVNPSQPRGGGVRRENATHGVVFALWAGIFTDGSSHQPPCLNHCKLKASHDSRRLSDGDEEDEEGFVVVRERLKKASLVVSSIALPVGSDFIWTVKTRQFGISNLDRDRANGNAYARMQSKAYQSLLMVHKPLISVVLKDSAKETTRRWRRQIDSVNWNSIYGRNGHLGMFQRLSELLNCGIAQAKQTLIKGQTYRL